jgi:hypothetical protein
VKRNLSNILFAILSAILLMTTFSAPALHINNWLIPKLHFVLGYETGEPVQMYFQRTPAFDAKKLEIKSVTVPGLNVRSWQLF